MKQFGKFYMIFDHAEFIKRIHEYVKDNNIGARWGYVVYDDIYNLYEKDGVLDPDLTVDGIHLQPYAYNIWAEVLKEYVHDTLTI